MRPREWVPVPRNVLALESACGGSLYDIDLERLTTSARVLDWIAQVASRPWASDRVIAGLVRALDAHLHLQANYCGQGVDRGPVNAAKVLLRERTRSIEGNGNGAATAPAGSEPRACPRCGKAVDRAHLLDARERAWHPACAELELGDRHVERASESR
jgi:hypothetical protein